jgi:hypothetical protein
MRIALFIFIVFTTQHMSAQLWDTMQHTSPFRQYMPQQQLDGFNLRQLEISKTGMYVLSCWGAANLLSGSVGIGLTHGEAQAFHASNTIWGAVNLMIGVPGVLASYQKSKALNRSFGYTILRQHGVEKIFLINAIFDFAYIGAGATAWGFSDRISSEHTRNIISGGGKSFIMQGGFLLLFDWSMYIAQSQHAYRNLNRYTSGLAFTGTGVSYALAF